MTVARDNMWDSDSPRPVDSTIVDTDSDSQEYSREYIPTADSPFYYFSTPPLPLVVSPVFPRCTGVCVFVPCRDPNPDVGFSVPRGLEGVVSRAKRSE